MTGSKPFRPRKSIKRTLASAQDGKTKRKLFKTIRGK